MGILSVLSVALLAVGATAQTGHFVDAPTGIEFYGNFNDAFGIRYGYSLPQNASQDFVGNIVSFVLNCAMIEANGVVRSSH